MESAIIMSHFAAANVLFNDSPRSVMRLTKICPLISIGVDSAGCDKTA